MQVSPHTDLQVQILGLLRPHSLIDGIQRCMKDKLMQVLRLLLRSSANERVSCYLLVCLG